jgi:hypothetical protein
MEENRYDVSKYSEEELYKLLGLESDVADRILEGRIVQLIKKYKNMQTPAGEELGNFFIDVHKRFFDDEEEIEDEGEKVENFETLLEQAKRIELENNDLNEEDLIKGGGETETGFLNEEGEKKNQEVVLTKEVVSSKGVVNPLIQQTIQRVVSIDSQYREDKTKLATDYAFQLSEPLRDVVSLSLYSVQIPYTWYTVNSNFGSNFFFLKGDAPGINTGEYDYQIQIVPGNYTAENLVIAINEAFQVQLGASSDIEFGNTNISYNVNNQITTLTLFIAKHYDELSYYFEFLEWSTSLDSILTPRNQTITSFLGFQEMVYNFNTLESRKRVDDVTAQSYLLPNTITGNNTGDQSNKIYYLTPESNNLTIISYLPDPNIDGSGEFDEGTPTIDLEFNIEFDLSTNKLYTRNQLETELNNQLTTNKYLINSSIGRVDISNADALGYDKSIYSLSVYFNRTVTNNFQKKKVLIRFPNEPDSVEGEKIWTGPTSCFRYDKLDNELNNVVSEYKSVPQTENRYKVEGSPYIELRCTKQYFDITDNYYRFVLINTDPTGVLNDPLGYLLLDYVDEMTDSIRRVNDTTKDVDTNPLGDFDMDNTKAVLTANSLVKIRIDLTKKFHTGEFVVDLNADSFLIKTMNFSGYYDNLFYVPTNKSEFEINATYSCFENLLFTIKPHPSNYGNQNMPEIPVYLLPCTIAGVVYTEIPTTGLIFTTFIQMQIAINEAITRTKDYENFDILAGSSITIIDKNNEKLEASITFKIEKFISERDFNLIAVDPRYTTDPPLGIPTDVSNIDMSWIKNLNFLDSTVMEPGYDLIDYIENGNPYAELILGKTIIQNIISITEVNNTFWIRPYVAGVTDYYGLNDLSYSITPGTYTRNQLVNELDRVIRTKEITENSRISIIPGVNELESFTKIRIEVKKTYNASDYKIVFYDPFSFAACYPGVESVRTATFDNTLGWTLGFRQYTIYYVRSVEPNANNEYILSGNTTVSTDLYNYLLITLDDFNQNRLNDGLVTIANKENYIPPPSYADKSRYKCDPVTGRYVYETGTNEGNNLTQAQLYTISEIANSSNSTITESGENYGTGPFAKDVFGLIPIKTASLENGNVYVEFGGTLQNQQRKYFGPVNINRMAVKLLSDKGDVMNLNGSNWSLSLVVEQLYQSGS